MAMNDPTALATPEEVLLAQQAEEEAQFQAEAAARDAEQKEVMRMTQRFRAAQQARQFKEPLWATLDEFDRAEQWKNAPIPNWIPKPITNFIRHYRTLKRANLASAIPRPKLEPVVEEDQILVNQLQAAHDHVWEHEKVPRTVRRCIDRGLLLGTSIAMVYTDENYVGGKYYPPIPILGPNGQPMIGADGQPVTQVNPNTKLYQGKICVKRIPIENFFPDPDAYRLEECKFVEITENVPLSTIKANKAFLNYAGERLMNLSSARPDTEDDAAGDIYERDVKMSEQQFNTDSNDDMVTLHTHFERYVDENGKWHLTITYYLQQYNIILYRIEDAKPDEYPFAVFYDEEEEKDFWGRSGAMDQIENQKLINKLQQVAAVIAALHQNPQKVVLRESGISAQKLAQMGTVPGYVWSTNVPNPIEIVKQSDIPRGLFEVVDRTMNDMRETMGLNEAYQGQSVGSLTTSTGVDSLIERATIRDRDKMTQIDEFVERISHLIVLNILYKWQEERPIPTTNPDGTVNFATYTPIPPLDAENLEWRVKSNVYAKAPITQASKRQQADKLLQLQGQFQFNPAVITPEEYIERSEFDDGDKLLLRMQADRQRLQAQQQINLVQLVMQLSMQLPQMMSQGMPPEQAQEMIVQQIQQALAPMQEMGQPPGQQQPTAPGQPQIPQGTTSQVAMANMANGRM